MRRGGWREKKSVTIIWVCIYEDGIKIKGGGVGEIANEGQRGKNRTILR